MNIASIFFAYYKKLRTDLTLLWNTECVVVVVIPGVSQIQRNHGMLEVHCSSKLSPDLKIDPDWVEPVIASRPVTGSRQQEINKSTNIQISIMDCFTGMVNVHFPERLEFFVSNEKRRYDMKTWVYCWRSYLSSVISSARKEGDTFSQR